MATGILTKLFKLLFAACHEEKKVADSINKRNKEIEEQEEEAKTLFDEIAREIKLTCAQGTTLIISTLGISIESCRLRDEVKKFIKSVDMEEVIVGHSLETEELF